MMKFILSLYICVNVCCLCSCKQHTIDKSKNRIALDNNFSFSSNFIATEIKGVDSVFTIIIQNSDFFGLLLRYQIVKSEDEYNQEIMSNVKSGKPILFSPKIEKILKDYEVVKDTSLKRLLLLDKASLVKKYVDKNNLITKELDFQQEQRIIYALIKAGVPCSRDDVSGFIRIKDTNR